jgi:hypothetical protein
MLDQASLGYLGKRFYAMGGLVISVAKDLGISSGRASTEVLRSPHDDKLEICRPGALPSGRKLKCIAFEME